MNQNLTLGQRLMADTPKFFKIAGFVGTVLVIAAAAMAYFHIPVAVTAAVGSLGTGIVTLSPFAVNDVASIAAAPNLLDGVLGLIQPISDQIQEVKTAMANPAPVSIPAEVLGLINQLADQPAAAPASPAPAAGPSANQPAAPSVSSAIENAKAQMNVV